MTKAHTHFLFTSGTEVFVAHKVKVPKGHWGKQADPSWGHKAEPQYPNEALCAPSGRRIGRDWWPSVNQYNKLYG